MTENIGALWPQVRPYDPTPTEKEVLWAEMNKWTLTETFNEKLHFPS